MHRTMRIGATALGGIVAGGVAATTAARLVWERATARAVERLGGPYAGAAPGDAAPAYGPAMLDGLPAPVARYLAFALTPGQPVVRRARVEHDGTFRARPGAWSPFTSVEHVAVAPPGFVWDATIRMLPLAPVRVRDSYLDGEGAMHAAAAAVVPVVRRRGTREMAEASLMRWLAEATWFPTALLPAPAGAGVVWTPVDDATARATLADRGVTVSVLFHFGASGEVVRTSAERYRDVDGTPVRTPWVGHSRAYARVHGMMIPTVGEAAWLAPEGRLAYWRGRVVGARYA